MENEENEKFCMSPMTLDEAIANLEDAVNSHDAPRGIENRQLLDWLRELRDARSNPVGNMAAMREALVKLLDDIKVLSRTHNDDLPKDVCAILGMMAFGANAALSAPARNCDVGTAKEQAKRLSDFCAEHGHTDFPSCAGCPLENTPSDTGCSFAREQMPYEEKEGENHE